MHGNVLLIPQENQPDDRSDSKPLTADSRDILILSSIEWGESIAITMSGR